MSERNELDQSTLDSVVAQITALKSRLGAADRQKLEQYLDSIRDVERRIQIASTTKTTDLPKADRPVGVPDAWPDYVKMLFDLQVLAYQADLTRVSTIMTSREASLMTFPHLGIAMQHHEASHHNYEKDKLDILHRVNVNQSELFAYYLDKMKSVKEGHGTMLDNAMVLLGNGNGDAAHHDHANCLNILAGKGGGTLDPGRYVVYPDGTPVSNLWLSLMDRMGAKMDRHGDSTGRITGLTV